MSIKKLFLVPTLLSNKWQLNPLANNIENNKTVSLLVANDIYIPEILNSKVLNIVPLDKSEQKVPNLLWNIDNYWSNDKVDARKLNILVNAYFYSYSNSVKNQVISRDMLKLFLEIAIIFAKSKKCSMNEELTKWGKELKASPNDLVNNFLANGFKIAIDKFPQNAEKLTKEKDLMSKLAMGYNGINYLSKLNNLIWNYHQNVNNEISSKQAKFYSDNSTIFLLSASQLEKDTYNRVFLYYLSQTNQKIYIDADCPYELVSPLLNSKDNNVYICRYSDEKPAHIRTMANLTTDFWCTSQSPSNIFLNWLANHGKTFQIENTDNKDKYLTFDWWQAFATRLHNAKSSRMYWVASNDHIVLQDIAFQKDASEKQKSETKKIPNTIQSSCDMSFMILKFMQVIYQLMLKKDNKADKADNETSSKNVSLLQIDQKLDEVIQNIKTTVGEDKTQLENLFSNIETLSNKFQEISTKLGQLQTTAFDIKKGEKSDSDTNNEKLNSDIKNISDNLVTCSNQLSDLKVVIQGFSDKIDNLSSEPVWSDELIQDAGQINQNYDELLKRNKKSKKSQVRLNKAFSNKKSKL